MENLNPNPNPNGKNSQQSDLQLTQKQVPKLSSQNLQQIQENSQNLEKNNNNETQKQIHFPIENPSLKKLEKNNSSNSQNSANKRNFEQFQNQSENVLNESQNQDTEILEEQEVLSDQHSVSKHSSSYEEQPGTPIVDNNQSYPQNTNNLNVNNNSSLQNDSLQNSQDEIGNSDKENLIEQPSQQNTNQLNSTNQSHQQQHQNNQEKNQQQQQQPAQKPQFQFQFQQRQKLLKFQDEIEYCPKKNSLFSYKITKINSLPQIQLHQNLINKQLHLTNQNTNKNYDHFYLQELTLNFTNNLLDFEKNFELLQNTLEQIAFARSSQQKTQFDSLITQMPTLQQIQQKQNQPIQQPIQFQLENLGFIHTFIKNTLNPQNHHLKSIKILEKDIVTSKQDTNTNQNQNQNQNQTKELLQLQQQPQNEYIYTVNFHPTPRKNSQTQKFPNSNGENSNNSNNNSIKNNNSINNNNINNNNIDNINIQKLITDQKKSQNLELNFPVPLIFRNQEPVFHKFNLGWQFANFQRQKEQLINQIDFHTEVFLEKNCTIEQLLIAYYKVKHHKFCNQFENFYNVQVSNFQNEYIIVDILFQYPDFEIQEEIQGNSESQAGNQMEIEENQSEETEEDLDQEDTQDSNTEQ